MITTHPTPPPSLPTLADMQQAADEGGMFLIHDGRDIRVSPIVPPGWFRVCGTPRQVRLWDEAVAPRNPLKEAA